MSNRRYPSPYLRYLRARLLNLGRPSFWGTAIFLSVVGLLIQQYWSNPNGVTSKPNVTVSDSTDAALSEEDKAIAADIDNLPALFGSPEPVTPPVKTNSKENQTQTPFLNATSKQPANDSAKLNANSTPDVNSKPTSVDKNIFVSQAEDLLRFSATDTNNSQFLGFKSSGSTGGKTSSTPGLVLLNQTNSSQNTNPNSFFPTVANQSTTPNLTGLNTSTSAINAAERTPYGTIIQSLPTSTSTNQTFSPSTGLNSPSGYVQPGTYNNLNNTQVIPANRGFNSGTGYIQPNTPNIQPNPYSNFNNGQITQPNTQLNQGTGYVQPSNPNSQPNSFNNLNNSSTLPVQTQPVPTVLTGTSPIIGPYSVRNPRANTVINTTPVVPNNQVPQATIPDSLYAPSRQGQYPNGVQGNGYSYP
ncbi:hypothetical protein [Nostoc sp. TCL26-01]|uniref:hypothetical protein n=1 Tax=Nostoc sp. TCL26-01 TaxID=2576904 RepID=UPI0015B84C19|nr:hypothetical protein [Nostoc sp. TCL26-01]QLE55687.1 hypothetical protein FD725_09255 [Nostoc sp. TCL26-01]